MHLMLHRAAIVLVIGFAATVAFAGAPGSDIRKNSLQHVCKNGPSAGSVCDPDTPEPCGAKPSGALYDCVLDFLRRPTLRGTLTVIADENPGDNVSLPGNPVITAILEIKLKGKTYLFSKSFQSSTPGSWPEIGGWLPPNSEADIEQLETTWPFQAPLFALTPFESAIEEATEAAWPGLFDLTGRFPIIVQAVPKDKPDKTVDQFADGDVGRVVRLKVRIQYAAPAP